MKFLMKILAAVVGTVTAGSEPNPPTWGAGVINIPVAASDTERATQQALINGIYTLQGGQSKDGSIPNEFSNLRYALLFEPGNHDLSVNVGFYTQVLGLGRLSGMTKIKELRSEAATDIQNPGALRNHWRGAENLWTKPESGDLLWAASEAAPLRRVTVQGNLNLFETGLSHGQDVASSGAFIADSYIQGSINTGSQRSMTARNVHTARWNSDHQNYNMVTIGVEGAPGNHCDNANGAFGATSAPKTPVSAEKPYIARNFGDNTKFDLVVPQPEWGLEGQSYHSNEVVHDFSDVYVANNVTDTAASINAKLAAGLHVVFQPGNYSFDATLVVSNANQVLLGLGFATLSNIEGLSVIHVGNVEGVRIAGLLLQADRNHSSNLLQWGSNTGLGVDGNYQNPGFLQDVFARVGGTNNEAIEPVSTTAMVVIYGGNVVIDNAYYVRPGQGKNGDIIHHGSNPVDSGLHVFGKNVTAYGLSVSNTLKHLVEWQGDGGNVWGFQGTFPYDADTTWSSGYYNAFHVDHVVMTHSLNGAGAFSQFRDYPVKAAQGFKVADEPGVTVTNAYTLYLGGIAGQTDSIENVVNGLGGAVGPSGKGPSQQNEWICHYNNGHGNGPSSTPVEAFFLQ